MNMVDAVTEDRELGKSMKCISSIFVVVDFFYLRLIIHLI
jgi:hypothetical protein